MTASRLQKKNCTLYAVDRVVMKMSVMTQLIRIVEPKSAVHIPLQPSESPGIPVGSLPVYLMYQTSTPFGTQRGQQLLRVVVLRDQRPAPRRLLLLHRPDS